MTPRREFGNWTCFFASMTSLIMTVNEMQVGSGLCLGHQAHQVKCHGPLGGSDTVFSITGQDETLTPSRPNLK